MTGILFVIVKISLKNRVFGLIWVFVVVLWSSFRWITITFDFIPCLNVDTNRFASNFCRRIQIIRYIVDIVQPVFSFNWKSHENVIFICTKQDESLEQVFSKAVLWWTPLLDDYEEFEGNEARDAKILKQEDMRLYPFTTWFTHFNKAITACKALLGEQESSPISLVEESAPQCKLFNFVNLIWLRQQHHYLIWLVDESDFCLLCHSKQG